MTTAARWPLLAFWVIFPGFFAYHALVAQGLPPVLRGYSVGAAVLALPLVALAWRCAAPVQRRFHDADLLVAGFVGMLLAAALWHMTLGASTEIVGAHLGVLPQWLVLYGTARLYPWRATIGRRSLQAAWLLITALVLAQAGEAALVAAALDLPGERGEDLATYQDFGLLYMMTTLAMLTLTAGPMGRLAVLVPALAVLFLNGARSEFLALLLGAVLVGWALSRRRLVFAAAAAAIVIAAPLSFEPLAELMPDNRIVDLIDNQAEGSLSERREMLARALETLAAHPVAGDYGSYAPGEYAHNAVSAWVDLGAAGFAWVLLMLALPVLHLALHFDRHGRDSLFLLALATLLLSILLLAAAKSFTYNLVPFALGAYAAARSRLADPGAAARRP